MNWRAGRWAAQLVDPDYFAGAGMVVVPEGVGTGLAGAAIKVTGTASKLGRSDCFKTAFNTKGRSHFWSFLSRSKKVTDLVSEEDKGPRSKDTFPSFNFHSVGRGVALPFDPIGTGGGRLGEGEGEALGVASVLCFS